MSSLTAFLALLIAGLSAVHCVEIGWPGSFARVPDQLQTPQPRPIISQPCFGLARRVQNVRVAAPVIYNIRTGQNFAAPGLFFTADKKMKMWLENEGWEVRKRIAYVPRLVYERVPVCCPWSPNCRSDSITDKGPATLISPQGLPPPYNIISTRSPDIASMGTDQNPYNMVSQQDQIPVNLRRAFYLVQEELRQKQLKNPYSYLAQESRNQRPLALIQNFNGRQNGISQFQRDSPLNPYDRQPQVVPQPRTPWDLDPFGQQQNPSFMNYPGAQAGPIRNNPSYYPRAQSLPLRNNPSYYPRAQRGPMMSNPSYGSYPRIQSGPIRNNANYISYPRMHVDPIRNKQAVAVALYQQLMNKHKERLSQSRKNFLNSQTLTRPDFSGNINVTQPPDAKNNPDVLQQSQSGDITTQATQGETTNVYDFNEVTTNSTEGLYVTDSPLALQNESILQLQNEQTLQLPNENTLQLPNGPLLQLQNENTLQNGQSLQIDTTLQTEPILQNDPTQNEQVLQSDPTLQNEQLLQNDPSLQNGPIQQNDPTLQIGQVMQNDQTVQNDPTLQSGPILQNDPTLQNGPVLQNDHILQNGPVLQNDPSLLNGPIQHNGIMLQPHGEPILSMEDAKQIEQCRALLTPKLNDCLRNYNLVIEDFMSFENTQNAALVCHASQSVGYCIRQQDKVCGEGNQVALARKMIDSILHMMGIVCRQLVADGLFQEGPTGPTQAARDFSLDTRPVTPDQTTSSSVTSAVAATNKGVNQVQAGTNTQEISQLQIQQTLSLQNQARVNNQVSEDPISKDQSTAGNHESNVFGYPIWLLAALGSALLVALVLAVVLICVCCRRRQQKKAAKASKEFVKVPLPLDGQVCAIGFPPPLYSTTAVRQDVSGGKVTFAVTDVNEDSELEENTAETSEASGAKGGCNREQ